jgi:hypothetical protein
LVVAAAWRRFALPAVAQWQPSSFFSLAQRQPGGMVACLCMSRWLVEAAWRHLAFFPPHHVVGRTSLYMTRKMIYNDTEIFFIVSVNNSN